MNRLEFLKEMKSGFAETVKSAFSPIVEDKVEQIETATTVLTGQKYIALPNYEWKKDWEIRDFFLNENSLYLVYTNGKRHAFKKQCPTCKGMLHINPTDRKCHCFICDQSISLVSFSGDLSITEVELKKKNDKWYVVI